MHSGPVASAKDDYVQRELQKYMYPVQTDRMSLRTSTYALPVISLFPRPRRRARQGPARHDAAKCADRYNADAGEPFVGWPRGAETSFECRRTGRSLVCAECATVGGHNGASRSEWNVLADCPFFRAVGVRGYGEIRCAGHLLSGDVSSVYVRCNIDLIIFLLGLTSLFPDSSACIVESVYMGLFVCRCND